MMMMPSRSLLRGVRLRSPSSVVRPANGPSWTGSTMTRTKATSKVFRRSDRPFSQRSKATFTGTNASNRQTAASSRRLNLSEELHDFFLKPRIIPIPRWITPRLVTTTFSETMGHSSFVLVAISYTQDDFLMLRIIAVAGSSAMMIFNYFHPHGRVLWLPFKWNALFIAINLYRIGKVYLDRYFAGKLSSELLDLRENNFPLIDPVEFAKLARLGSIETFQKGEVLVNQGDMNSKIRVVLEGELKVLRDDKLTYLLEESNFVSEAGLHAGLMLPGAIESCCKVMANKDSRVMTWERSELLHLLDLDAGVRRSLQNAMSWDIVRKLKLQRTLISRGLIDNPEEWTRLRSTQTLHRYRAILQNLIRHPHYLKETRRNLEKYRMIHLIDDESHLEALKECGISLEEFEDKDFEGVVDVVDDLERRDWHWYMKDLYFRFFG